MKKSEYKLENKSFRSWIRQLYSGIIKRQKAGYLEEIFKKLQYIEDMIEILSRKMARQSRRRK